MNKVFMLLSCLFIVFSYADEKGQLTSNKRWKLAMISQGQILDKTSPTRDQVIQEHLFTEILLDQHKLLIQRNSMLTTEERCSFASYWTETRTAAKQWPKLKERELYKKLLAEGGIQLQDTTQVYTFASDTPAQEGCYSFFKQIYKINEAMIAETKEGYLLFFYPPVADKALSPDEGLAATNVLYGDPLVSHDDIITRVNQSCIFFEQVRNNSHQCVLSKAVNNYVFFAEEDFLKANDKLYLYRNDQGVKAYITRFQKTDYSDYRTEVSLFLEKNNQIKDKLIIYKQQVFAEASTVSTQYYFIDKQFDKLWLLDTFDSYGEGVFGHRWYEYEINKTRGYFKLIKAKECTSGFNQQNNFATDCKDLD